MQIWPTRIPFSIKFFLVAITFLLFDLEIALLLLLPWALQTSYLTLIISTALILVIILVLGLTYEWAQKGLDWTELVDSLSQNKWFQLIRLWDYT